MARGRQAPQTFCTLVSAKKRTNPLKQVVFAQSVEAEAAQMFAAKKRIENQRKEIVTLLQYAYGNRGLKNTEDV